MDVLNVDSDSNRKEFDNYSFGNECLTLRSRGDYEEQVIYILKVTDKSNPLCLKLVVE